MASICAVPRLRRPKPVDVDGHPSLRLLRSLGGETSSVFWDQPIQVGTPQGASSVSQQFRFRVSDNRNTGADGIVFVIGPSRTRSVALVVG